MKNLEKMAEQTVAADTQGSGEAKTETAGAAEAPASASDSLKAFAKERGAGKAYDSGQQYRPSDDPDPAQKSKKPAEKEAAKEPEKEPGGGGEPSVLSNTNNPAPSPAPKTEKTPSQLREERIRELKAEKNRWIEKHNNAVKEKDDIAAKLAAFEYEKALANEDRESKDNFYQSAVSETIPDSAYYKDLVEYYGKKIDSDSLNASLEQCANPHGTLYCLLQWMDEDKTALETWGALSPMMMRKYIRELDGLIAEAKERHKNRTAPPSQTAQPPAQKEEPKTAPKKEIPKSVVAETNDSTNAKPSSAKGLSAKDALAHFKMYGASGVADEE